MKLYNTYTRRKEEFKTIEPKKVKIYTCGPTVYSYIHIGNARPMVVFDAFRRYLEFADYEVIYVQNFTDVDDKIINCAVLEGVLPKVISEKYIEEAVFDQVALNIKTPSFSPKVTEEMDNIIKMIELLQEKGYAYEHEGTVYFNTKKFAAYGKLSGKNIEELEAGSRVVVDNNKQNVSDFVLWKPAKENEPKWASPWGEGRPGWHIECSAIIREYLGETIDIHAGGEDLVFPHHENEIAQSFAATGKPLANYWLHNGFINVDNQKMSKSSGNFFTIRDISEKFDYSVIRFFILSAHYRTPINFSDELLQAAENGLNRIKNCVKNVKYILGNSKTEAMSLQEAALVQEAQAFKQDFCRSMEDDINTADAISAIFDLARFTNINVNENSSKTFLETILSEITEMTSILGLELSKDENTQDTGFIEEMISKRQEAKKNKDYKTADSIRDELDKKGIILEDTSMGVRWSYKGR